VKKLSRRTFQLGKAEVSISPRVISSWRKLPADELEKIIDSVCNVWRWQRVRMKRSELEPLADGVEAFLQLSPERGDSLEKMADKLSDPTLQSRVLNLLPFTRYRKWIDSPISELVIRAICRAAYAGDEAFFRRLGKVLTKKPIVFGKLKQPEPLANFLTENWVAKNGVCLCWFTDSVLAQVVCVALKTVSFDDVKKTRQRLRLYRPRRALVHCVQISDQRRIAII